MCDINSLRVGSLQIELGILLPPAADLSILAAAVWHLFNTTVSLLTFLFGKKNPPLWLVESLRYSKCLSVRWPDNFRPHTHKHIQRLAATGQSITQNKAWKPRVKPSRPCERVIVCEAVCAFQCVRVMTAAVAKEWPSIGLKWAKHPWVKLYYVDHP